MKILEKIDRRSRRCNIYQVELEVGAKRQSMLMRRNVLFDCREEKTTLRRGKQPYVNLIIKIFSTSLENNSLAEKLTSYLARVTEKSDIKHYVFHLGNSSILLILRLIRSMSIVNDIGITVSLNFTSLKAISIASSSSLLAVLLEDGKKFISLNYEAPRNHFPKELARCLVLYMGEIKRRGLSRELKVKTGQPSLRSSPDDTTCHVSFSNDGNPSYLYAKNTQLLLELQPFFACLDSCMYPQGTNLRLLNKFSDGKLHVKSYLDRTDQRFFLGRVGNLKVTAKSLNTKWFLPFLVLNKDSTVGNIGCRFEYNLFTLKLMVGANVRAKKQTRVTRENMLLQEDNEKGREEMKGLIDYLVYIGLVTDIQIPRYNYYSLNLV